MSFVKLPKTCQDHVLGLDSVNQGIANTRALYLDMLDPFHELQVSNSLASYQGRHDDPLIARTVAHYSFNSLSTTLYTDLGGPLLGRSQPIRRNTGQWKILIYTPRLFSAHATIEGASTGVPRHAMCHVVIDDTGPYVIVSTWNMASGQMDDYDFSLAVWASGVQ